MSIPYRPFQPGIFSENDSTVDQLLDELNMAEEYSHDRKHTRDRQSTFVTTATSSDPTIAFGNANCWNTSLLGDVDKNGFSSRKIDSYRYRDRDAKRFPSSTATGPSSTQFHDPCDIGRQSSRKRTTSAVHETGSESGWAYRHPIIMQSIKSSTMTGSNANKRKNNLSKASISPNLNVSFLSESERLAKTTDLFLLPSDDSGGGHLYTNLADTSPSDDCSELMQVCFV